MTRGVATWGCSNVLTEASSGRIEVWMLESTRRFSLSEWQQVRSHLERLPEGRVFLFADQGEISKALRSGGIGAYEVLRIPGANRVYVLYVFDHAQQLKALLDGQTEQKAGA